MWNRITPRLDKILVSTIVVDNWFPELCAITLPRIEAWAGRIGADFKIITEKKFPGWPPNYERFQMHEFCQDYFWSICLDADYLIHPEKLENPTSNRDPFKFYCESEMSASYFFAPHPYLLRDKRNLGVADNFIMASWFTSDLWNPLPMSYEEALTYCLVNPRQVSEFCFTLNAARYGLKSEYSDPVIRDKRWLLHLDATTHNKGKDIILNKAKDVIQKMEREILS